jgi:hypothetical protein
MKKFSGAGPMSESRGVRAVSYFDCPGGGQVVVDGTTAYVGHTNGPEATTILDVGDPANPRQIAQLTCPHGGVHAHKVRVRDGLMVTNYESKHYAGEPDPDFVGGMFVYDITDPREPRQLSFWPCAGSGTHRFTFDGRYAYISPEMEGYVGNIVLILDLKDPARPEVRRRNRELALTARRILCAVLDIGESAPESMVGAMAAVPIPPAVGEPAGPFAFDPLQDELYDRYRIEAPVITWLPGPGRILRVSAQLYNRVEDYESLANVLAELVDSSSR